MRITDDNLVKCFDRWPPFLLYALARKKFIGGKPAALTLEEIVARSGLSVRTCYRLVGKTTWANETLKTINSFSRGCNFSWHNIWKQRKFLIQNAPSKCKRFGHLPEHRWLAYLAKCAEYEKANRQ